MVEESFITLRGHHLDRVLSGLSLNEWARYLYISGYLEDSDPLPAKVFDIFERIKTNPNLLIRLVDSPDDICHNCARESCSRNGQIITEADIETIDHYGFRVGEVYTAEEILNTLRPTKEKTERYWREELRKAEDSELRTIFRRW